MRHTLHRAQQAAPMRLAIVAVALTLALPARAAELLYQFRGVVLAGEGTPELAFAPEAPVSGLTMQFKGDCGKTFVRKFGAIKPGVETVVKMPDGKGVCHWSVEASGTFKDGSSLENTFEFETAVLDGLVIHVQERDVDLRSGVVRFDLNREGVRASITVIDGNGGVVEAAEADLGGKARDLRLRFNPNGGDIGKLLLKVWDRYDFWSEMEVKPFEVGLPHEEVQFEFGKADVRPSEEPKLEALLAHIRDEITRLSERLQNSKLLEGGTLELKLYVAAYTDTVGSPAANQELSERRAASIGRWFRDHGLTIPILTQGFGESVLFQSTADEVAEAANRRSVFVLRAHTPEPCSAIPRQNWTPLR